MGRFESFCDEPRATTGRGESALGFASRSAPVEYLVLCAAFALCGCGTRGSSDAGESPGEPGLPRSVSTILVSLGGATVVDCRGTLIDASWVLTAAHCFSDAPAEGFAFIRALGASVRIDEIVVHPGATRDGASRAGGYSNQDIVAAHDLALIPLRFSVIDEPIAELWQPGDASSEQALEGLEIEYARTVGGEPFTARATLEGLVDASNLLDNEQSGRLLAADGPVPHGGDSGGGAFLGVGPGEPTSRKLMAVVQNAPLDGGTGRFGLVPLWVDEHRAFIDETLASD